MTIAAIPSPSTSVWQLGPVPIRAYALCIVLGILLACVVTEVRLRRRGAAPGAVLDIAVWAVPFGIIGARVYHVISSPQAYFGANGNPIEALYVWQGGLSIWGSIAGGAVGAWIATRQLGLPLTVVADALAPGLPLAQAVGRIGNWFNNELYGGPTSLPWGLRVHDMDPDNPGHARVVDGEPVLLPGLYHPAFLYEALWNVGVALLVFAADRRWKFGRGRAFALYVMGYTIGRFWIEFMRTDPANEILGVRLNVWTAALVFLGALVYFLRVRGPRQYLLPRAHPDDVPDAPAGGVSQRDVTGGPADRRPAAPAGYDVVSEEEFLAHARTGARPVGPAGVDPPGGRTDRHGGGDADRPGDDADRPGGDAHRPGAAVDPAASGAIGPTDER